ncbi:Dabb family protein [Sphingomonas sp. CCH5-D11]|uniref:Dabb family protein n=1 Tax=Sphingomonas sp. CCH5-D11 TaxID=1768786 RepID=UPI00082F5C01|nr:Dabb family protein [Sphingomonas sp. CCH5-D11]
MDPASGLLHVVLYKLASGASDEQRQRIERRFRDLPKQIDGVFDVWAGANNSQSRFAADWSFGVVMTLRDREARDAFLQHEAHLSISRDAANGFYEDVTVFDLDIPPEVVE